MRSPDFQPLELAIARARIVLNLVVLAAVYVDPATDGLFDIGGYALVILVFHFAYSLATSFAVRKRLLPRRLLWITAGLDIIFASALAASTENTTSPAFSMFLFAIVAAGCWAKLRVTILVTSLCVVLYILGIWVSAISVSNAYLMRAVYLAIGGYLINFFGREREKFEARERQLETEAERHTIARSLHDGYMQSLAGISLRLETCRDMLVSDELSQAVAELAEVQIGVDREFDEVRAYVRSLAQADQPNRREGSRESDTQFRVHALFTGNGLLVEQIMQIMLEGIRNAHQNGQARSGEVSVVEESDGIRITIDDDGIGFDVSAAPPWTIASRVAECGGLLRLNRGTLPGAHIEIVMPVS